MKTSLGKRIVSEARRASQVVGVGLSGTAPKSRTPVNEKKRKRNSHSWHHEVSDIINKS
jgi:hypothetical protein